CGFGRAAAFGFPRRTAATAKIGDIPTGALELKTSRRDLLGIGFGAARRALGKNGIGQLLQDILLVSAGTTLVGVNGHDFTCEERSIMPGTPNHQRARQKT